MATTLYSKKSTGIQSERGFTLAELLIVVAIIGVLTAVALPVFTSQLEKSRESKDLSDVRNAYAELMNAVITSDEKAEYNGIEMKTYYGTYEATVEPLSQTETGWALDFEQLDIGGVPSSQWVGLPAKNGSCTIQYVEDTDKVYLIWKTGKYYESGNGVQIRYLEFPPLTETQKNNAIEIPSDNTFGYTSGNGGHAVYSLNGAHYEDYNFAVPNQVYVKSGRYYISDGKDWYAWSPDSNKWYRE